MGFHGYICTEYRAWKLTNLVGKGIRGFLYSIWLYEKEKGKEKKCMMYVHMYVHTYVEYEKSKGAYFVIFAMIRPGGKRGEGRKEGHIKHNIHTHLKIDN